MSRATTMSSTVRAILAAAFVALVVGCSGTHEPRESSKMKMRPCPSTPNCVSSDATDRQHAIAPFELAIAASDAWPRIREALESMPRTRIVESTDAWVHAEAKTAILRFTDDLELELRPDSGIVAVRSASRVGHSDLGVNRKRVERLRRLLVERGIVKADSTAR